jgi:UDP-N-acetylmuramoyl-tripeptide--D-alanyl-D-alanine ligase
VIHGTLEKAAQIMAGTLKGGDREFCGISTDTRSIHAGELFFALQGPNFDGNRFVSVAADRDAAASIVNRSAEPGSARIVVEDTRRALGRLAADWRRTMPATIVGITGSNGKTTLKTLVASCLSQSASTLATQGNLNNDIGVPTMLARLSAEHRYAVIEMGANRAGEIAWLAEITGADVVVITNAAPAHLEGFGSVEGVAKAKGEILDNPMRPSVAVLNADDKYFSFWSAKVSDIDVISFGLDSDATVRASDIETTDAGSRFNLQIRNDITSVNLPLPGRHNVGNACAAAAVATALELPVLTIKRGLESVQPVNGRLQPVRSPAGYIVYNDSYNANPQSVIAAAKFLAGRSDDTWLILGDMGELGVDAVALHSAVGREARQLGIKRLYATGNLSKNTVRAFGDGARWFDSIDELLVAVQQALTPSSTVLIKGSRSARMERVVDALLAPPAAGVH